MTTTYYGYPNIGHPSRTVTVVTIQYDRILNSECYVTYSVWLVSDNIQSAGVTTVYFLTLYRVIQRKKIPQSCSIYSKEFMFKFLRSYSWELTLAEIIDVSDWGDLRPMFGEPILVVHYRHYCTPYCHYRCPTDVNQLRNHRYKNTA